MAVVVAAARLYLGAHFLGDGVVALLFVTGLGLLGSVLAVVWSRRRETSR